MDESKLAEELRAVKADLERHELRLEQAIRALQAFVVGGHSAGRLLDGDLESSTAER